MAGESLVALIHQIASQKVKSQVVSDLITGEVISVAPLKIKVSDKLTLSSSMLMLGHAVKETWINVPIHEEPGHIHECNQPPDSSGDSEITFNTETELPRIKLWRGLKIGDKVRMIRFQSGQMFYVIEREEGITNDSEQSN